MTGAHGIPVTHESVANFSRNDQDEQDDELHEELQSIFTDWREIIEMRHAYMYKSAQNDQNPKDSPDWVIYPPPPPPSYKPEIGHELDEVAPTISDMISFDLNCCEIPEPHHVIFYSPLKLYYFLKIV